MEAAELCMLLSIPGPVKWQSRTNNTWSHVRVLTNDNDDNVSVLDIAVLTDSKVIPVTSKIRVNAKYLKQKVVQRGLTEFNLINRQQYVTLKSNQI